MPFELAIQAFLQIYVQYLHGGCIHRRELLRKASASLWVGADVTRLKLLLEAECLFGKMSLLTLYPAFFQTGSYAPQLRMRYKKPTSAKAARQPTANPTASSRSHLKNSSCELGNSKAARVLSGLA